MRTSSAIFSAYCKVLGYLPFEFDMSTLPGRLKAYRLMNGLSQKQLGKILKVDGVRYAVGNWAKTYRIRKC
jgi:hypothetical protein